MRRIMLLVVVASVMRGGYGQCPFASDLHPRTGRPHAEPGTFPYGRPLQRGNPQQPERDAGTL